jgi:hypothetical protein
MCVRRTHLHHVLPLTRAEEAPAAAITEVAVQAPQAALTTEAIPLLREVLLQAQAVAQVAVTVAEAVVRAQAPQATVQVQVAIALAEAVEAQAVEEDNLLSANDI